MSNELAGLQDGDPLTVGFGSDVEVLKRDPVLILRLRAGDADAGVPGDEGRGEAGGADELGGTVVAEDGVVAVVAVGGEGAAVFAGEQAVPFAEVPAVGEVTEGAAEGAVLLDLDARISVTTSFRQGTRRDGAVPHA